MAYTGGIAKRRKWALASREADLQTAEPEVIPLALALRHRFHLQIMMWDGVIEKNDRQGNTTGYIVRVI